VTDRLTGLRALRPGPQGQAVLMTILLEKVGSGLWVTAAAIYLTQVDDLSVRVTGIELGLAGLAGLAGSPLAGILADRFNAPRLCSVLYLLRAVATWCLLLCTSAWSLPMALCAWTISDRGTAALQRMLVADAGGADRIRFQALARVVTNVGLVLGALGAAGVFAATNAAVFHAMIGVQGVMYLCAAAGALRIPLSGSEGQPQDSRASAETRRARGRAHHAGSPHGSATPWRDRGYLLFTLLELPLFLDNSLMGVGLPLWIVELGLPHFLVSAVFVVNAFIVIAFQLRLSAFARTSERTAAMLPAVGAAFLTGCCCAAAAAVLHSATVEILLILAAAAAITIAEMVHTATSWELAVALAPKIGRNRYVGVYGLSQAGERAGGPLLMTGAILTGGALGWPILGFSLVIVSTVQKRIVRSRQASFASGPQDCRHG
jgi:MFS family permease